jgi:hypothetical protein
MKWAFCAAALVVLTSLSLPAEARLQSSDRQWIALAAISLLSQDGSSEPGLFYSTRYEFEPGILVRMQRNKRLTLGLGVTQSTFTMGPSLRIGKSRLHLSGGVASDQDRFSTFHYTCLSWRWNIYY